MKTIAIIQARMGSTRLPGKVLTQLGAYAVIEWVVRAARAIKGVDRVVIATSTAESDNPVADWCCNNEVPVYRGPEEDVLERFMVAIDAEHPDVVMRLTADCPFLDPDICAQVLALHHLSGAAYASNVDPASWPDGLDCEVMTASALRQAAAEARLPKDREHVTPYIRARKDLFPSANLPCGIPGLAAHRWTLDTPEDLRYLNALVPFLDESRAPGFLDVLSVIERSGIERENAPPRNEGYSDAWRASFQPGRSFTQSQQILLRAEKSIPLGSQTFSKSHIQYPQGAAPLFLSHGDGGRCWDVDGNEYVDMVGGLLPLVLGYRDPDVDGAIREQLDRGITFSLATELEIELAELLIEEIPCAEKVRYGKNGSDATSATVRLARAATGRDRIAVCGYHGWQDWYIGSTTRNKGVPQSVRNLTHAFPFADLDALHSLFKQHPGEFAAVVVEPMNVTEPPDGYYEALKELVHANGALLVFDEIITGFRFALGGAQSLFGITPDLAAFGKSMGNGMPISAVVGRADLMSQMEDIFFSSTFGGETLSLAASIATIKKMRREPVIETLWATGQQLAEAVVHMIKERELSSLISLKGFSPWKLTQFQGHGNIVRAEAVRTMWMREMLAAGVLSTGSHNVCYAHSMSDIAQVIAAWGRALDAIVAGLASDDFEASLGIPPIESIFKVR